MSFLDDIAKQVDDEISEENISAAIDKAAALAGKSLDGEQLLLARKGLVILSENKSALAGLARGAAAGVLTSMVAGDTPKAMTLARMKVLTFEERSLLMRQGTSETMQAADKAKKNMEALVAMLEDGGKMLLTKALPFILAAL